MIFDQRDFDIRHEWGPHGVAQLAPHCDAVVIVDVLTFSTAVVVAAAKGAAVYPYRYHDESAADYARSVRAVLAGPRSSGGHSLSPRSLMTLPRGSRIVLPSPNGATLSLGTGGTPTFAGCLRNPRSVALAAMACGPRVAVIACGERWQDGSLRPSLEDQVGAGAVLAHLNGSRSPEATAAIAAYEDAAPRLLETLQSCVSGKELIGWGFPQDVVAAADLNRDHVAPRLRDGAFTATPVPR